MAIPTIPAGARSWRSWEAYLLVFATSLCTLVLEIVAGRVLAPTIGVSLYTWTSIIGVVLAGVALGNYAGGLVARRAASAATLAMLLAASGLSVWIIGVVSRVSNFEQVFTTLEPLSRIVALSSALFFIPSLLLGTVTPLVAQLLLRDRADAGAVVGRLGAVSAAGSIAGTFLAGFVFIPTVGSRAILFGVAGALIGLAGLTSVGRVRLTSRLTGLVVLAGFAVGGPTGYALSQDQNACLRETAYYCIRYRWSWFGDTQVVTVRHDRITQGYTAPEAPQVLVAGYVQTFADVALYAQAERGRIGQPTRPLRALFIGGGSYTLPRYLEAVFPSSQLDVLEIDPEVTAMAQTYLGLEVDGAIRVRHGDARVGLRAVPGAAYDLVFGDAFNDISVPWHLATLEAGREVRRVLTPGGHYVVNVIDSWSPGQFLAAFVTTLRRVFPEVAVLRVGEGAPEQPANWIVVASAQPLDQTALQAVSRPGPGGREPSRARVVAPTEVDAWLAGRGPAAPVLTDDYAPVDWLLANALMRP